jgi:hypothetical protein
VPLENIDPNGQVSDLWYPLKKMNPKMASVDGEVIYSNPTLSVQFIDSMFSCICDYRSLANPLPIR